MKTSNKILLAAFTLCYVIGLITISYAKENLEISIGKDIQGNGILSTKIMTNELRSHKLILDGIRTFILDPHSTQVVIEAEENILPLLEMQDDHEFEINHATADHIRYDQVLPIKITIGIKGKDELIIEAEDQIILIASETINLKVMKIEAEDRADIDLDVNAVALNVENYDRAKLKLSGDCNAVNFIAEDNSKTNFDGLSINALNLNMEDNAVVSCNTAKVLSGSLEDNASAYFIEEWKAGATINSDESSTEIGSPGWD